MECPILASSCCCSHGKAMEVFTPSSGGRRNVVDIGSPSNDSEDVIAVYVTRGLIKAKKSGMRRRMRKTGKIK